MDEISSCASLLRSSVYRAFLVMFCILALLGNLGSIIAKTVVNRSRRRVGFDVFVTNLCLSDCLMGVYLAVIGLADRMYEGDYLWKDAEWRHSAVCKATGFLSLLSSEVSALIVCLITLDRFLVLRFPLSRLRFSRRSALLACAVVWTVGVSLAAVPLLPATSHWHFYSQTGICIPLPITRTDFPGRAYSFGVVIVLNFGLFVLIAVGQIAIYYSIQANRMTLSDAPQSSKDAAVARRLLTVAVSDFLCWFPVGVSGLLAASGVAISGEVNVAMALLVLPVNSAINPFLYTINTLLERRRQKREEQLRRFLLLRLRDGKELSPQN